MAEPDYPNGHPQVAQVAIQQGELLAENLQRIEALKKTFPPGQEFSFDMIEMHRFHTTYPK